MHRVTESWDVSRDCYLELRIVTIHTSFPSELSGSRRASLRSWFSLLALRRARSIGRVGGPRNFVGTAQQLRQMGDDGAGHNQDGNAQRTSRGEVVRHINTIPDHLPPRDTKRWTARRKASVVAAMLSRRITVEEVCQRYGLSVNEFLSSHNAMQRHGLQGLRTTKLQNYRYSRPKKD